MVAKTTASRTIILDMSFYGIATAFTGKSPTASFHCNVVKLDTDKTPAPSAEVLAHIAKYPWSQKRLTSEADFEILNEKPPLSNINLDDDSQVREVALKFIATVAKTIELQKQDEDHGSSPVHIIIGQDGRNGHDYYTRKSLRGKFVEAESPDRIRALIKNCRFHTKNYSSHQSKSILSLDPNGELPFEGSLTADAIKSLGGETETSGYER
ncbi:MAG: hypothetical protein HOA17_09185 [Candidatus Melainabacteria bacterium]|jgi:hypothetical protein|nr:hypothetical protein [Candidatus Melainabacteria bacterium]